jgi:hypothetical protein
MKPKLVLVALVTIIAMGCRAIPAWEPTPTPLPGWRSPADSLLVDNHAFPEGWVREREFPDTPDPTVNHVYRQWWGRARGDGAADQAIWRAYTIEDAQEKYSELRRQPMLLQSYTPSPWDVYVEFESPPEIDFQSQIADELYLACGWLYEAQCHVIARYRNYVTYIAVDLEAEYGGYRTVGLTYAEIEAVVEAMDAKFAEAMEEFYPTPP